MPRVIIQKSSGAWWKCILAFIGGAIFGVGAVAGGVVGVAAYFKTGEVMQTAGLDPNKILTEEYQQKTILDIVLDATGGKIKINTLGDINEITPLIDTYVTNLSSQLNDLGCELTKEEIYSWPLTELSDKLINSVKKVELISFLSKDRVDNPDPIVKYLCYKTDDQGEFVLDDEGHYINLSLSDLMDNSSFIQTKINTMKLKVLFTQEEIDGSPLLKALQDKSVTDLSKDGALDDILVADLISDSAKASSKILQAFEREKVTVGGIGSAIDTLYLDDVFPYKQEDYDNLPSVLKKLLAKEADGTFPGRLVDSNPFTIKHMDFNSEGYPIEYDYVVFSDGSNEHKTDYIPITKVIKNGTLDVETGFINSEEVIIHDDLTVEFVGNHPRDVNDATVTINITAPSSWDKVFAFSCNKAAKVKDLDEEVNNLQLKDVMKIKPSDSLWKVRNENVSKGDKLFNSITKNLTLVDILPSYAETKFLKAIPGDTKINEISEAVNSMQLIKAFEDNIYDKDGKLDSMWKYLLIESGEDWIDGNPHKSTNPLEGYACASYTVGGDGVGSHPKGVSQLMENIKNNMKSSEIRQLNKDGITNLDETNFVNKKIPTYYQPFIPISVKTRYPGIELTFGHMTINEFSSMISTYSPVIP